MKDYVKLLPQHIEKYIGENELFLEVYDGEKRPKVTIQKPPLLFVHGAYTGSWMWCKYLPHFIKEGFDCYVMNMRSHYKSRAMDLSKVTFEDYLEDIKEIVQIIRKERAISPIVIAFSMGGILSQKLAEAEPLSGLVLVDSSISSEVFQRVPYETLYENNFGLVVPAPERERLSIDESEEDVAFQVKYLSMESTNAFLACGCWIKGVAGVTVNSDNIKCPVLVIKAVNSEADDRRGRAEADHLHGEYFGYWSMTHTGLLVGKRYQEPVLRILKWLEDFDGKVRISTIYDA